MIVHFMCVYYPQWAHVNLVPRSQDQWHSFKFCRAVKKRIINGTLSIPLKSGAETISSANVGRARELFGNFIENKCRSMGLSEPVLIPIPSKDGLIGASSFRSQQMLDEAVSGRKWLRTAPVLRFRTQLQPANAGGPRGRYALSPHLILTGSIPEGQVVLVDDILTSGGSLLDPFDTLAAANRPPFAAIMCGRTLSDSLLSAFGDHKMEIDTSQNLF